MSDIVNLLFDSNCCVGSIYFNIWRYLCNVAKAILVCTRSTYANAER